MMLKWLKVNKGFFTEFHSIGRPSKYELILREWNNIEIVNQVLTIQLSIHTAGPTGSFIYRINWDLKENEKQKKTKKQKNA